ncbi:DUF6479 family protein [Streptomyces sp. NPDC088354]|uniref:DUF6479 family protein n=1 Tax=unclassified Streptomyces TaxID=2593676 RepID=UPI0029AE80E4|nr:DUF6479 family protein [Streptomyces sp. MI02-7b]MDX3074840.1 DUF6479 family protein [Streptomyces sp. MI02-7b]
MRALEQIQLAVPHDYLVGIAPLVVGIFLVGLLIGAVSIGLYARSKEPPPEQRPQPRGGAWHTRQEYGRETPADHGPGHQDGERHRLTEWRDYDEWPQDGIRHLPHSLKGFGNWGSHGVATPPEGVPVPKAHAAGRNRTPGPERGRGPANGDGRDQRGGQT